MTTQQDVWTGGSGSWNTPTSWSAGAEPLSTQDAFIGVSNTVLVSTTANETVNSIGTDGTSSLLIGNEANAVTFTATDGTVLLGTDSGSPDSGNLHDIGVSTGSNLVIGDIFLNEGTITVAVPHTAGSSGAANLKISGQVTLTGGGTVDLGVSLLNATEGDIVNLTSGDGLTNVNNTITGNGVIALANFDNQAGGVVEVSGRAGNFLDVYATGTWKNEGKMIAESNLTLDLGANSTTTTLTNSGSIVLDQGGLLAISGNFTLTGTGSMMINGEGGDIITNATPATFINESTIEYDSFGQIGGSAALTFDNFGGMVDVQSGTVTIYTGSNAVTDNDGGLFEAEAGSQLVIESPVDTGGFFNVNNDTGGGGTIEADGGSVFISAAIAPGGSGVDFIDGDVEIGAFSTVFLNPGASIAVPIVFSGPGAVLAINNAADQVTGEISGLTGGDFLDLEDIPFAGATANWSENRNGLSGVLTVSNGSTSETFDIDGDFSTSSFKLSNDGDSSSGGTEVGLQNPSPTGGATAVMVMFNENLGDYEIYDIGGNAILGAATLEFTLSFGNGTWFFSGLGDFNGSDTSDMLMRNAFNGGFEAYYIANNTINTSVLVGTVGLNYAFSGIGDFDGASSLSELLLRNSTNGAFELYQVSGGGVLSGSAVAAVGNNFTVEGFGFFSESSTTQMMMQGNSGASLGSARTLHLSAELGVVHRHRCRQGRDQSDVPGLRRSARQRLHADGHAAKQWRSVAVHLQRQ